MKIKGKSKYINQKTIEKAYKTLWGADKVVFRVFHKLGIRLGEFTSYIDLAEEAIKNGESTIDLTPQKKNNKRLLPVVIDWDDLKLLSTISTNREAIEARVRKWGFGFSSHDLRATWVTNALEKELNPIKIMTLGGWKDMKSMLKYSRLTTENSMWMYDYITKPFEIWETTDDVAILKQELRIKDRQLNKLKAMNQKLQKKKRFKLCRAD